MAYHNLANSLTLLLPTLFLLLALGNSLEEEPTSLITKVTQIRIDGFIACTPTGNYPSSGASGILGAAGVIVSGTCNGGSATIGQAVTNTSGFYSVFINGVDGLLFDIGVGLPCFITVKLPVVGTTCQAFLPTGVLQAPVKLISIVTSLVGGLLGICSAGPFQYLAV